MTNTTNNPNAPSMSREELRKGLAAEGGKIEAKKKAAEQAEQAYRAALEESGRVGGLYHQLYMTVGNKPFKIGGREGLWVVNAPRGRATNFTLKQVQVQEPESL